MRYLARESRASRRRTSLRSRAVGADGAGLIEQSFFGVDECLRLAQRRHVEDRENIAQELLRHRRSDGARRRTEHPGRFTGPRALPVRTRGMVNRVLQYTGDRTVVFRRDEQQTLGRL